MLRKLLCPAIALGVTAWAGSANAAVVQLTFEGLQNQEEILEFYNGGTGSLGSSGPNVGVSFGDGALSLIDSDAGGSGNFANEPSADTVAFWLSGDLIMNVAAGFDTGFSFWYTSRYAASIDVYDGLNGTGTLLASIALTDNFADNNCTGDPTGAFCNWDAIGVAFAGTAKSVDFGGTANQTAFDNITFGTDNPVIDVPAPGTLGLLGFGFLALGFLRRRRTA